MNNLYYEELYDRRLWIDGDSTYSVEHLSNEILKGEDILDAYVHGEDSEFFKFSKLTGINLNHKSKPNFDLIDESFNIPDKYKSINLEDFFIKLLHKKSKNYSYDQKKVAVDRIFLELEEYELKGLTDILRLAIFIVDTFEDNSIIWGPGRGSSCCSYLLFLIGLHDVDSIVYELDIYEFLRDD